MRVRLTLTVLALFAARVSADEHHPPHVEHPSPHLEHTHARAGNPQCVAWYAVPGRTDKYGTGYVGGGCLGRTGEPRQPDEGVWGWDYVFCGRYPGRVFLNWCQCHRQPPAGPYKTDGPHVPDVFSVHPLRRLAEAKGPHGEEH
jgi:hypothetical protein